MATATQSLTRAAEARGSRSGREENNSKGIRKVATGIAGFDEITYGGLPMGRPTIMCGGPGCGKTTFGVEFLVRGAIEFGEIIDLMQNPKLAQGDQILAVPTLVRNIPKPIRKIIGDMSNVERVLVGLDIISVAKWQ